jgi:hypothetical protein
VSDQGVPITAVIATVRGWPEARQALAHLVPQVVAERGETLVADGSGNAPPSAAAMTELGGPVTWLSRPGESVFRLRRAAYNAARGDIVAVTEDHVFVQDGWVRGHVEAHARYPDAGAVGGAVLNGTDRKLVDWGAFLLTQGPFMPPIESGVAQRISGAANVSYKRRVIERLGGDDEHGIIDFLELPMALEGEQLVADDSIRVLHHQSQGFWRTSLAEFDNGRTIAGYRRRRMERGDWLRLAAAPILPVYRTVRAARINSAKQRPPRVLALSLPVHMWFQYCAMAGEVLGYVGGPGGSPRRLY